MGVETRKMELLYKFNVFPAKFWLEKCMITYMLVNGELTDLKVKVSLYAIIEVIDLEESKESEKNNSPNFKESQRIALQGYNY